MKITMQRNGSEDEQVSRVIEKVLNQVFGEEATILIYKHLERNFSLKRNEVCQKIEVFANGLEDFLTSGAYVIERKILEDIRSSYGLLRRLELEKINHEGGFVSQMKLLMHKA